MTATLEQILAETERRLAGLRARASDVEAAARAAGVAPSWPDAFAGPRVAVIAEVKRRSPSAGAIAPRLDPAALAGAYVRGGARAVSVLTEQHHFGGSLDDLEAVRRRVDVPILRKDFVLDPLQIVEARAAGASAVLLIVRALDPGRLRELAAVAREWGLACLVEVHDVGELEGALALGPEALGVNSRDLTTFAVNVAGIRDVLTRVPPGVTAVAESGIAGRADVERVAAWGADAVLVGTALARAGDPAAAVADLVGVPRVRRASA